LPTPAVPDRTGVTAWPGRARLGRSRQECVEPGQLGPAAREGRHRRRQLGWDRYRRCGLRHRGRGRGCVEGGILPEDGRLQVAQLQAGVDAEFLIERAVQAPVGGQRVGLPAAAVQRQHELGLGLLIQRPGGHQLFQFGQQRGVLPGRQPGLEQGPPDRRAEQFQAPGLLLQPGQPGQVGQGSPAPQGQCCPQPPRGQHRISRLLALVQQALGDLHVGPVWAEIEDIARWLGADRQLVAQHVAQLRHVALQRVQHGRRRAVPPTPPRPAG
jgi:hypothetical protein